MTISGLVSHLRWMEHYWFQVMLGGEEDRGPWTDEDPDREMRIAVQIPLAQLLDQYEASWTLTRAMTARATVPGCGGVGSGCGLLGVGSSRRSGLGRHRWRVERARSWLSWDRRLRVRWDRGSDRFLALVLLACALVCCKRL
jgi:hypothetical protein